MIPAPKKFEPYCSVLHEHTILFLNIDVLLDLGQEWLFLYSTKLVVVDLDTFFSAIKYRQPTILVIAAHYGAMIVIFASTRWCDTEERWAGNGDSYIFGCKPKMVIFYSTEKH